MILTEPNLISADLAASMVRRLEMLEFSPGHLSAGPAGQGLKNNLQLVDTPEALAMSAEITKHLQQSRRLAMQAAIKISIPFMFNSYGVGMEYKAHTDNPFMSSQGATIRADLSATVFLSPVESYDGGELIIYDDEYPVKIKLPPGGIVLYPGNTVHRVAPVTRGVRWAAVTWLQSSLREVEHRRVNSDLVLAMDHLMGAMALPEDAPPRQAFNRVARARDNLLRLWSE